MSSNELRPPTVYERLREIAEDAGAYVDDYTDELMEELAQRIERSAEQERVDRNRNG